LTGILLILVLISWFIVISQAYAANPGVFPISSNPYGKSYEDWSIKWWQWILSIPKDVNPLNDDTGRNCGQKQEGPVWYLAGTPGGTLERTCTIPAEKAILFPVLNGECTYADAPDVKNVLDLRNCSIKADKGATNLKARIDNNELQDIESYRVTSSAFPVNLVDNNILAVKPGPTTGVSDGWWILLNPLPPGKHEIHFSGRLVDPQVTATSPRFLTDVIYHLTVHVD
jgi:hypothetical protein